MVKDSQPFLNVQQVYLSSCKTSDMATAKKVYKETDAFKLVVVSFAYKGAAIFLSFL